MTVTESNREGQWLRVKNQEEQCSSPSLLLSAQEISTIESIKARIRRSRQHQQTRRLGTPTSAGKNSHGFTIFDAAVAAGKDETMSQATTVSCSSSESTEAPQENDSVQPLPPLQDEEESPRITKTAKEKPKFGDRLRQAFACSNSEKKSLRATAPPTTPSITPSNTSSMSHVLLQEGSAGDASITKGMFQRIAQGTALTSMPPRRTRSLRSKDLTGRGKETRGVTNNTTASKLKSVAISVAISVGITSISIGWNMLQQQAWRFIRRSNLRRGRHCTKHQDKKKGRSFSSCSFSPRVVLGSAITTLLHYCTPQQQKTLIPTQSY